MKSSCLNTVRASFHLYSIIRSSYEHRFKNIPIIKIYKSTKFNKKFIGTFKVLSQIAH